jgi:hypothetical protein
LRTHPQANHSSVVISTVVWFLEELALHGELTWSGPSTPLSEHLRIFEELIIGYVDRLLTAD